MLESGRGLKIQRGLPLADCRASVRWLPDLLRRLARPLLLAMLWKSGRVGGLIEHGFLLKQSTSRVVLRLPAVIKFVLNVIREEVPDRYPFLVWLGSPNVTAEYAAVPCIPHLCRILSGRILLPA